MSMDIVAMAMDLAGVVNRFVERARHVYYAVVLMGHECPECGGSLVMIGESRCRCTACGHVCDPTAAFQRCPDCGGTPRLRVRRYQCQNCGSDVASRFVFDGLVFDAEYFRQAVAESRQRQCERRDRLRHAALENRSAALEALPLDLGSVPGLVEALDSLTAGPEIAALAPLCQGFDLNRYEMHIQAHLGPFELYFDDIPPSNKTRGKTAYGGLWR